MDGLNKKVLLLSTGDANGAYEAIYKLGLIFIKQGCQVVMLVKTKSKSDSFIKQYHYPTPANASIFKRIISKITHKISPKKTPKIVFDPKYNFLSQDESKQNLSATSVIAQIGFTPDVILSGMTINFINSTDLFNLYQLTNAQVYNITVDMNHYTGGCHYAWDCKGYIDGCSSNCPAIISNEGKDLAKINFEKKKDNAKKGNFKIISGSGWTLDQSKKSLIYKNQELFLNVNSLIDTELFTNKNRAFAKNIFGLDNSKFYILMGCQNANDSRKGFDYLVKALQLFYEKIEVVQKNRVEVLIVSRHLTDEFSQIPFAKRHIPYVSDYRLLSLLYQASNIFVNSSIEDSGPMMVSEALACGTPVVGFDMGVVNNMVVNNCNGYKALLKDSEDLSNGIFKIFSLSEAEYATYSLNAVEQVQKYSSLQFAAKELSQILT